MVGIENNMPMVIFDSLRSTQITYDCNVSKGGCLTLRNCNIERFVWNKQHEYQGASIELDHSEIEKLIVTKNARVDNEFNSSLQSEQGYQVGFIFFEE